MICRRSVCAALLGDEALLGEAHLADRLLEPDPVELAGRGLWKPGSSVTRRAISASRRRGRMPRARSSSAGFGDHLPQMPVEAERARLVRRDRPADLAAELLQPVVVDLAELLDAKSRCCRSWPRSSGRSRGKCRRCPRPRSLRIQAHHHAHDDAAEPIGGGFTDTSKHRQRTGV